MRDTFRWVRRKEDRKRFYLQLSILSMLLWVLAGLVSFLALSPAADLLIRLLVGLAPCWLLLFAVLTWLEVKREKPALTGKPQRMEDLILLLCGLLAVFAEIVHQKYGGISYALPLTVGSLAIAAIVRIIAPQLENKKETGASVLQSRFSSGDILKIIILGSFVCLIFTKFIASFADILSGLSK